MQHLSIFLTTVFISLSSLAVPDKYYSILDTEGEHPPAGCDKNVSLPSDLIQVPGYSDTQQGYLGTKIVETAESNDASVNVSQHYYNTQKNCQENLQLLKQAQGYACQLNSSDLKSALNLKPKYFKATGKVIKTGNSDEGVEVKQTVVLKNGQKVTYTEGGCAHFSYSFAYQNAAKNLAALSPLAQAQLAIQMLQNTPVTQHGVHKRKILVESLETAIAKSNLPETKAANELVPFSCGDASCDFGPKEDEPNTLVIGYSFPL